jgi:hypothetical protein
LLQQASWTCRRRHHHRYVRQQPFAASHERL